MEDVSFKPAGMALAAVVAGLAGASSAAEAPEPGASAAAEAQAAQALADAIAAFEPSAPFEDMVVDAPVSDVPLGA